MIYSNILILWRKRQNISKEMSKMETNAKPTCSRNDRNTKWKSKRLTMFCSPWGRNETNTRAKRRGICPFRLGKKITIAKSKEGGIFNPKLRATYYEEEISKFWGAVEINRVISRVLSLRFRWFDLWRQPSIMWLAQNGSCRGRFVFPEAESIFGSAVGAPAKMRQKVVVAYLCL